jgi:hypothetical protein
MPELPMTWNNPRIGLLRVEPLPDQNRWWFFNFSGQTETVAFEGLTVEPEGKLQRAGENWEVIPHALFSISLPAGPAVS